MFYGKQAVMQMQFTFLRYSTTELTSMLQYLIALDKKKHILFLHFNHVNMLIVLYILSRVSN